MAALSMAGPLFRTAPWVIAQLDNISMRLSRTCSNVLTLLAVPAVVSTLVLYLYPFFFRCAFPEPITPQFVHHHGSNEGENDSLTRLAPFRLLVFGDPQIEGDTSLPGPSQSLFPSLENLSIVALLSSDFKSSFDTIRSVTTDLIKRDIPLLLWSARKRLDLFGNDYYLAHIYRTLHWWLNATHVAVLGDLVGSQWISDEEFWRRADRYWTRAFTRGARIDDHITQGGRTEVLGADPVWRNRIINVAGNHDIGYAGELTAERLARFEQGFGRANWDVRFQLPSVASSDSLDEPFGRPELRLVILNNMNLDGPAYDTELQDATYDFINSHLIRDARPVEDTRSATVLLTHVPLHKETGVCVDGPLMKYWPNGALREQNHLSAEITETLLESVFGMSGDTKAAMSGMGRNGLILDGHDHEGCDVWHYPFPDTEAVRGDDHEKNHHRWTATRFASTNKSLPRPGLREITVRSMMGAYGGNAGLLSGWFDTDSQTWQFEYATCPFGVQHYWWAVHVLDVIVTLLGLAWIIVRMVEGKSVPKTKGIKSDAAKQKAVSLVAADTTSPGRSTNGKLGKRKSVR